MPFFGTSYYTINADFQTGQAVTPGQGQSVTIAGVKVGVISGVDLENGVAVVSMNIDQANAPDLPRRHDAVAPEVAAQGR